MHRDKFLPSERDRASFLKKTKTKKNLTSLLWNHFWSSKN